MRLYIIVLLLSVFITSGLGTVRAGELEQAYEKEFAYLVAEKKALEQRLVELGKHQNKTLSKVVSEIDVLQAGFLKKKNLTDRVNRQLAEASRDGDHVENDSLLLDTTIIQATESLKKLNIVVSEKASYHKQLAHAFSQAKKIILNDGNVNSSVGQFYLPNGEAIDGSIVNVGRIAKYGSSSQGGGVLAPAGNGQFKVWSVETKSIAQQLSENLYPEKIDIFLYDGVEKGIEKAEEKTFKEDVKASGLVGEVIIYLGIVGFILALVRVFFLSRASSNIHKTVGKVNNVIVNRDSSSAEGSSIDGSRIDVSDALAICKKNNSAVSNVIAATLRSLHKERDHIEDIISESILHESSVIDRFGAAIIVIAAISPLLGLLGTVTGMISTFDIITKYGTGDPKLLSSGISEALLTTKFGLVVAIPLLVMGNLLSSWGQRIKNELEQAALHIINTHKA